MQRCSSVYPLSIQAVRTHLEVVSLHAEVVSLGVGGWSELQGACVDVEASMFGGERGRHELVILKTQGQNIIYFCCVLQYTWL